MGGGEWHCGMALKSCDLAVENYGFRGSPFVHVSEYGGGSVDSKMDSSTKFTWCQILTHQYSELGVKC